MLIDTHCHLHDREFFGPEEAEEIIQQAKAVGVERIICIGTDPDDSLAAKDFALAHDGVYWTYGVHPSETANLVTLDSACSPVFMENSSHHRLDDGEHVLKSDKLVAIGENRTLGPPLENNPEPPPSSRLEGLRLLYGLETSLSTSLQTPQEA